MKVKDVSVLFDNLCGFDYRVIADLYDEDGFYIGQINKNYVNGELFVSDEVRAVWRNGIKFSRMCTLQDTVMFTLVVLKGEEKWPSAKIAARRSTIRRSSVPNAGLLRRVLSQNPILAISVGAFWDSSSR